jgi:hypothetical protein
VQTRIIVDGAESAAMKADLEACLGEAGGDGWVVSAVQLGPVWWCLNVLAAPGERLRGWSAVGQRVEVTAAFRAALQRPYPAFELAS